jgi:predicted lipase
MLPAAFSLAAATTSALYSAVAYCSNATIASWTCSFCRPPLQPLQNATYLYNSSTETAGLVGFDAATSRVILSFRGTVTTEEWVEDFDLRLVDPVSGALCGPNATVVCVANGFYFEFASLRAQMHAALSLFPPSAPIVATGHSLGAVMAEYAAWELGAGRIESLYTFGTPRGGNPAFARSFQGAGIPAAFRVTHGEDPVPHLPPEFFNYRHPPQEVFFPDLNNWTDFRVCSPTNGEDGTCSDSVAPILPFFHNYYMGIEIDAC